MKLFKLFLFGFVFWISFIPVQADNIDSLKLRLSRNNNSYEDLMRYYTDLSKLYIEQEIDSAKYYTEIALELAVDNNDDKGIARMYARLGQFAIMSDDFVEAEKRLKSSVKYFEGTEYEHEFIDIWLALGNIHNLGGNYTQALKDYQSGIASLRNSKDSTYYSFFYTNIAAVNTKLGDYNLALDYHLKSYIVYKNKNDTAQLIRIYLNIGTSYLNLGDTVNTRDYFYKALEALHGSSNYESRSSVYNKVGILELNLNNYVTALDLFKNALESVKKIDNSYYGPKAPIYGKTYLNLGKAYYQLGEYDKAIENYRLGLKAINKRDHAGQYEIMVLNISMAFDAINNIDSAYHYYKIHNILSDSLINIENIREATKLEMKYKYEAELEKHEFEHNFNEKLQNKKSLIRYLISFSVFIILLLVLLSLFLGRRNALKKSELKRKQAEDVQKNLQKDLEFKDKELFTNAMYLLKKGEFIQSIASKLQDDLSQFSEKNQKLVDDIISDIYQNTSHNDWKEFETRFQQVHTEFYKNLHERIPNLTPNELKLCAFLKLNMSTKDIAALTFQSTNSIEVARYRLRKKVGLDSYDNIVEFLNKI